MGNCQAARCSTVGLGRESGRASAKRRGSRRWDWKESLKGDCRGEVLDGELTVRDVG